MTGDAYFYHAEMDYKNPRCTPGLDLYQRMLEKDRQSRLKNQVHLRHLAHEKEETVRVFCSHDIREFEQLSGRTAEIPAGQLVQLKQAS